jgi:hypothetical protein
MCGMENIHTGIAFHGNFSKWKSQVRDILKAKEREKLLCIFKSENNNS